MAWRSPTTVSGESRLCLTCDAALAKRRSPANALNACQVTVIACRMDYRVVAATVLRSPLASRGKSAFWAISVALVATLLVMCGTSEELETSGGNANQSGKKISCTNRITSSQDPLYEVLRAVNRRHSDALMAIPGVNGTGVGSVYKDGEYAGEIGIIVFIDQEIPPGQADPRDVVPSKIEGCTVSIRVSEAAPVGGG